MNRLTLSAIRQLLRFGEVATDDLVGGSSLPLNL